MKLADIAPLENWVALEKEINKRSGLNASVFDENGFRITNFQKWANRLCPAVKGIPRGQQFICAVAHQNIAAQTLKTRKPVVDECDAGLVKFAVPIFIDGEFLGVAGGCGLIHNQEKVDTYLIHRTTGLDESDVQRLSDDIGSISDERLTSVIAYVEKIVAEIIREYKTDTSGAN
jgi:ligand-binding sensor protein